MQPAPLANNESQRLAALQSYEVLDSDVEQAYDDLTTLAAVICDAPIALVSLIDMRRQWFKSRYGLDATETPRDQAFCAHAILQPDQIFIVNDATRDTRFHDNPLVTGGPEIRFYAGAPLIAPGGEAIGTLCVMDRVSRDLNATQRDALMRLSRQAMAQLELRKAIIQLDKDRTEMQLYQERLEEAQARLERINAHLETQSVTDPLTGLYNRRALAQQLGQAIAYAHRHGEPLSLVMLDIDHFKSLNDGYGHLVGDETLRHLAEVLRATVRASDIIARYGGEEIAIILPNLNKDTALTMGERLRTTVESAPWLTRDVTISVGITTCLTGTTDATEIISQADQALYRAKRLGRNRAIHYRDLE